ncbi:MAG TPA: hypothetical protein VMZ28_06475 [Kofleriaceae bacterium]|nr:hypothetical protein [Kofleriaceae bacterium]
MRPIIALLLATACGGSGGAETTTPPAQPAPAPEAQPAAVPAPAAAPADRATRCASFVERSRPVMQEMASSAGKTFTPEHEAELRTTCEEKPGSNDEVLLDCVLGAADEPAVKTCWKDAMQRYIDKAKANRDAMEEK